VAFCRRLSVDQLEASAVGRYGSVRATIQHLLEAEAYYGWLLSGGAPEWWSKDDLPPATLDELERWNEEMAEFWEGLLARPFDPEGWVSDRDDEGTEYEATAGVIVAQVLNHGNEHRSQVFTILTTVGVEPPEVDPWAYGLASGRHVERKG
jgi:uncharacterized damage-inducible protein DinB